MKLRNLCSLYLLAFCGAAVEVNGQRLLLQRIPVVEHELYVFL